LQEGNGECPGKGANVTVHYVGTFEDGKQFDSSRERGVPLKFRLGYGMVISGWDIGIASMKTSEKAILKCSPKYCYGTQGSPRSVPPNATLTFEIELLSWEKEPETVPEKCEAARKCKEKGNALFKEQKGNALFKEQKFQEANEFYEQAQDIFRHTWGLKDQEKKQVEEIQSSCLLNQAICKLKLEDYSGARLKCEKVLDIDKNNVKSLFRRGQAYAGEGEFDKAKRDFMAAIRQDPKDPLMRKEYEALKKREALYKQKNKDMFTKMGKGFQ